MRVTVLITYFNKGAFVEEAVRSVLDSSFSDLEVLVVDDASTDGGLDHIQAIGDPRVRILSSLVNTGRAAAANRGFEAARGEYVAILDADDRMMPDRLERQVAFMDAHVEVGVSGGYLRAFGRNENELHVPADDAEARAFVLFGMPVFYPTCIIRRSVLEQTGVRCDPAWRTPGMDHVFMLRLLLRTRIANLPVVLTEYRRGEQNMRHGRDDRADRLLITTELFRVLGLPTDDRGPELFHTLDGHSPSPPDAKMVKAIHTWMDRFRALNRSNAWFDTQHLEVQLQKRWNQLFHVLPDHDPNAAWVHAILTRPLPIRRLRYLLMMQVKRVFGSRRGA